MKYHLNVRNKGVWFVYYFMFVCLFGLGFFFCEDEQTLVQVAQRGYGDTGNQPDIDLSSLL